MSLNDSLWGLLEKLKLAEFFDRRHIPPIAFPILILAIIAIPLFFFFSGPPGEPNTACGNGICDNETESVISCPKDCARPAATNKVIVEILNDVKEDIEVKLEDSNGNLIQQFTGRSNRYTFASVSSSSVKALVKCPLSGEAKESDITDVEGTTTISMTLPEGFFGAAAVAIPGGSPGTAPAKGTLKVILKDSATQQPVSGRVTVVIPNGASQTQAASKQVTGTDYFPLDANQWYAVIVQAEGYALYDNRANPVRIDAGQERPLDVLLQPITVRQPATLSVCVKDNDNNLMTGLVAASLITGEQLSQQALSGGCTEFELESGNSVQLSTSGMPSGCTSANGQASIVSGANYYNLSVTCGNSTGHARVKVLAANGTAVTNSATITMWYANASQITGTGAAHALAIGSENYTESIILRSSEDFYYVITGVTGYSTITSSDYTVYAGEDKYITITLQLPPAPAYNFTFQVAYPSQVRTSTNFTATISSIKYGSTVVTNNCTPLVSFAGRACNVTNGSVLTAICSAGGAPGTYDISVSATYSGHTGSKTYRLSVLTTGPIGYFELIPYALLDTTPPITIDFDIKFNGTFLDSLTDSSVTVKYDNGGVSIPNQPSLTGGSGLYSMTVDSPYPGQHTANIYLMKVTNNIYEQNFTYSFTSTPASVEVTSSQTITPQILEPGEAYNILATIKYNNAEVPGLLNLYVTADGQRAAMSWDPSSHAYTLFMAAPSSEGIYPIKFELDYQQLAAKDLYVVDTTKSKAALCDISDCQNVQEVRKCVYRHRYEAPPMYSEQDTKECIEQGMPFSNDITHCTSASADRGDWAKSCKLDSADVSAMADFLNRVVDQIERNTYAGCGDMENDGDVDDSDKACLSNVISGNWIGDTGDGSCSSQLKGGFCFDIADDLPGDFDGNDNFNSNDASIMQKIMAAVSAGVTVTPEILAVADFDKDGAITGVDQTCMDSIAGSGQIASDCLKIYNFTCPAPTGDMTGDGIVDDLDLLLARWAVDGRISCVKHCTDINYDGICNENDYECLLAISTGDTAGVEEYCTNCMADNMAYGIDSEGNYLRYGQEICNDGLDNDCDDEVDEDCNCDDANGERLSCENRNRDYDGILTTNDFQTCRWNNFYNGGGWQWQPVGQSMEEICWSCEQIAEDREMQYCSTKYWCKQVCAPSTHGAGRKGRWLETLTPGCVQFTSFMFNRLEVDGWRPITIAGWPGYEGDAGCAADLLCCDGLNPSANCGEVNATDLCPTSCGGVQKDYVNLATFLPTLVRDCGACCVKDCPGACPGIGGALATTTGGTTPPDVRTVNGETQTCVTLSIYSLAGCIPSNLQFTTPLQWGPQAHWPSGLCPACCPWVGPGMSYQTVPANGCT